MTEDGGRQTNEIYNGLYGFDRSLGLGSLVMDELGGSWTMVRMNQN
jgi:hypothetical protein